MHTLMVIGGPGERVVTKTMARAAVGEELPIFLVVFAVPAAIAGFLWWKFS